jgi:glycine cleavage system aminomethyltransferase T
MPPPNESQDERARRLLADEVRAVRESVAYSLCEHVSLARISGPNCRELLDAVCPRELYVQDGQMLHTLLLDADARPLADAYVCAEGDDYLLLADGLSMPALRSYLEQWAPSERQFSVLDLSVSHRHLSLNGPYAWELLSELLGPELIGLPYLGFYQGAGFSCFRAGRTGEYGYELWLERESASSFLERLLDAGREFDLGRASLAALDACALENWFFNPRREGRAGLSPIELQLQWRISYQKAYPGSARLAQLRQAGAQRRAVLIASARPLGAGDRIEFAGELIGELLCAEASPTRGDQLGIALLNLPYAHPGLVELSVGSAGVPARVLSAPAVNNRSLYVDPQRHTYRTRQQDRFPALVIGRS